MAALPVHMPVVQIELASQLSVQRVTVTWKMLVWTLTWCWTVTNAIPLTASSETARAYAKGCLLTDGG